MKKLVADASLLLAMVFPDEKADQAVNILDQYLEGQWELLAPELVRLETLNACLTAMRRGRITESAYIRIMDSLSRLVIRMVITPLDRAEELARKHSLSAYDAAYLAVAVQETCLLATLDEKLKHAAEAEGLPGS